MTGLIRAKGGRGRARVLLLLPIFAVAVLVLAISASAGTVGTSAKFEDDDGDLAPVSTASGAAIDWNSFAPLTWTGSAPTRAATKSPSAGNAAGWVLNAKEDYTATNSDTGFAGGTKQDKDCGSVIGTKAPNKDDLKRIYIAHKT